LAGRGTDCDAVGAGYAALTPLKLDSTDLRALSEFEEGRVAERLLSGPRKGGARA
jgi:hypothetical protein